MRQQFSGRAFDELNYSAYVIVLKKAVRGEFTEYVRLYVLETSVPAAGVKVQSSVGREWSIESVSYGGDLEWFEGVVNRKVENPEDEPPFVFGYDKL